MSKTILVEGGIATGKSLFLNVFNESPFSIRALSEVFVEPLDEWRNVRGLNLFSLFSRNPEKYSFPFESYVYLTMLKSHTLALKEETVFRIMERSLYSAHEVFVRNLFDYGFIDSISYEILCSWYYYLTENDVKSKPEGIIYLKCRPETQLERIRKRERPEETNIKLEYLINLNALYGSLIEKFKAQKVPVYTIDTETDLEETKKDFKAIIHILNLENTP